MSKTPKHITVKPLFRDSRVSRTNCKSGKICYKNELSAKHALTVLNRHASEKRDEKRIYRCDDCGYFHLTSMATWRKPIMKNIPLKDNTREKILHFKDIHRALDEVNEKFSNDPSLSIIIYNAVSEFKIYSFDSTSETLKVIDTVMGEIFHDDWTMYKRRYSVN